jgi:ring-1,2-phenylacetyl-CoA epoxidase subunit PaaC
MELVPETAGDSPYDVLAEDSDESHRWAFGTGFTDPLDGVDTSVPAGLNPVALARYCLALGDDALIYSHRLQQWVTRMPELEEETALANIALDLLGQARLLLARAGSVLGRTEDELAFFRGGSEFRNVRLAEQADGDFAELVGRLLIFSAWRLEVFTELAGFGSAAGALDPVLAAIAAKGVSELTYHRDYAARWVVRLGDGTSLSHARMQAALDALWPPVGELFAAEPEDLAVVSPDAVDAVLRTVLTTAGLRHPAAAPGPAGPGPVASGGLLSAPPGAQPSGRAGQHTEAMDAILAELQCVARAYPDATW